MWTHTLDKVMGRSCVAASWPINSRNCGRQLIEWNRFERCLQRLRNRRDVTMVRKADNVTYQPTPHQRLRQCFMQLLGVADAHPRKGRFEPWLHPSSAGPFSAISSAMNSTD